MNLVVKTDKLIKSVGEEPLVFDQMYVVLSNVCGLKLSTMYPIVVRSATFNFEDFSDLATASAHACLSLV